MSPRWRRLEGQPPGDHQRPEPRDRAAVTSGGRTEGTPSKAELWSLLEDMDPHALNFATCVLRFDPPPPTEKGPAGWSCGGTEGSEHDCIWRRVGQDL